MEKNKQEDGRLFKISNFRNIISISPHFVQYRKTVSEYIINCRVLFLHIYVDMQWISIQNLKTQWKRHRKMTLGTQGRLFFTKINVLSGY